MSKPSPYVHAMLMSSILLPAIGAMPDSPAQAESNALPAANYVHLNMLRVDNAENPEENPDAFDIDILVSLEAEIGVTGVSVTTGGGSVWAFVNDIDAVSEWSYFKHKASVAAIVAETNGTWTIEIFGSSPSTTTFTVNTSGYVDGDFYPTPTGLSPANGATDVPVDTLFSWNDPTGPATAEAMYVSADSDTQQQEDSTFAGSLLITDTSWDSPLDLDFGNNAWEVGYFDFDEAHIGTLNVTAGSILWGDDPIAPIDYPASSPLLIRGSWTRVLFTAAPPPAVNYVELDMQRSDNAGRPGAFDMDIFVRLEAEIGVTGVTVTTGGGSVWPLENDFDTPSEWSYAEVKASVAAIVAETNGTWTIDIFGSSPSTTTFTVNTSGYVDGDFYPTPTGLSPANGATDVPVDTLFSWNDPTGPSTAEVMGVSADSDTQQQEDNTFDGSLLITDTSWDPPLDLDSGNNAWEVMYADFDEALIGTLNVTAGSIIWGDHPIAPIGYPALSPLLTRGSYTVSRFDVLNPCPADTDGSGDVNVTDLIALLAGWGPNPGHVADFDGNGSVNVDDLITLLAAWGACP